MNEVFYNSRSELDKLPFGAVSEGAKIRFGLRLADHIGAQCVFLVLRNDATGGEIRTPLPLVWRDKGFSRFEGFVHAPGAGLYWYYFEADIHGERRSIEKDGQNAARFSQAEPCPWQLTVYESDYTTPQWIMGGAFYHILVDRFNKAGELPLHEGAVSRSDWGAVPVYLPDENGEIRNNDFFGGNLEGIIQKLPYLKELNISCIYLSPIFEAASNHKYDTGDYTKIDPSFGDEESFSRLCSEAARLGISVICDGVFNHTGDDSKYFNRYGHYDSVGAYQSKASPYFGWYCFEEYPDKYDAWWGIKTLPQLNEENEELCSYLYGSDGVLKKWMRLGASGWRLDVADELCDKTLDTIRQSVKSERSDALIIGEVWEDASNKVAYGKRRRYFQGRQLDSVMNYPFKNAIVSFVKTGCAEEIREAVESICENYPKPSLDCMMNGLGTHDTPRILTVLGGEEYLTRKERAEALMSGETLERAKALLHLASVLQFTLPGVPCVYYGDEAGMQGYEDPFNRRCYPWGSEDKELLQWYKALLGVRRHCACFAGGDYKTLCARDGLFVFLRRSHKLCAVIAANMGAAAYSPEPPEDAKLLLSYKFENGSVLPGGCAIWEYSE